MPRQSRLTDHWPALDPKPTSSHELNFVFIFPPEISAACFSLLPIDDLIKAYNVSRSWRHRITRGVWRNAFLREANYEYGDLRRVLHLEQMEEEWDDALDKALERAHVRQMDAWKGPNPPASPPSLTPSDFSEYTAEVPTVEATTEWRRLCLQHLRRKTLRSKGILLVRWAPEVLDHGLIFGGIHSINNQIILFDSPSEEQDHVERQLQTVSLDRQTLKKVAHFDLPPAVCYKMQRDNNIDNILHRFRHQQATQDSPAIDWVELWIPYQFISKMTHPPKEVGIIPAGTLQTSQDLPYIHGLSPFAAINIDEVEGASSKVQVFTTKNSDNTLTMWIRIGSKACLLSGKTLPVGEEPPSLRKICRFVQSGTKLEIEAATDDYPPLTLPVSHRTGPPAAVFYQFVLQEVAFTGFRDRKLSSGTVKRFEGGRKLPSCRAHRYLAAASVPGDRHFNRAMDPSTVESWAVTKLLPIS
ncbi:uncharacterized protein LOC62_07G009730 [Vanrija pseudolonga]|uniref:F-box domain-containing protein n=1 Tax=Vanrija pseudolonga TaxID=143232 RepID=A0AAF0YGB6_9TREE|nr:hypothetical protein LOC62_07G009730 [Vanrija pseudolonga]